MSKTVNFGTMQTSQADKIVKDETAKTITGFDTLGNQIFEYRGVSDFTLFTIGDGEDWDT